MPATLFITKSGATAPAASVGSRAAAGIMPPPAGAPGIGWRVAAGIAARAESAASSASSTRAASSAVSFTSFDFASIALAKVTARAPMPMLPLTSLPVESITTEMGNMPTPNAVLVTPSAHALPAGSQATAKPGSGFLARQASKASRSVAAKMLSTASPCAR